MLSRQGLMCVSQTSACLYIELSPALCSPTLVKSQSGIDLSIKSLLARIAIAKALFSIATQVLGSLGILSGVVCLNIAALPHLSSDSKQHAWVLHG